ncbi:general stress protein [Microbacterium sp. SORGH_AS_0888]|uniref:general stress protein n=1 Tax=Microbacterium sp. SORGH_AS_0888 TaxID=3041791 RepID=UPI002787502D|nr:general stress protein [Microbacterium sp. SORGH_AS_0888]MDQ1128189.1 hypothetical protein [Microbacterium sp. SORGH_AS_0888]
MSMMGGPFSPAAAESGATVASFSTYEGAQKAVSALIAGDVPAREIAIVGQGLRSVERVTGRLGYAAAARSGAVNGVVLGILFSFVVVLGTPNVPIQVFVGVLLLGIAVGMLLSLVSYALVRRRRDYASVMQIAAERYDVKVSASSVQRARDALGVRAPEPPRAPEQPASSEPPRYGERIAPPQPASPPKSAPQTPETSAAEPDETPGSADRA